MIEGIDRGYHYNVYNQGADGMLELIIKTTFLCMSIYAVIFSSVLQLNICWLL